MTKPVVYFTKEITPDSLIRIYERLGKKLSGKIGVKISTGEPGGHNYLKPELIGKLVQKLDGAIIECNTAYAGRRNTTDAHWKAVEEHGFPKIAKVDLMDADGEFEIPVHNGKHLDVDIVALPSQPADLELWFWDWLNVCKIADMKSWAANYILRPLILMSYVSA